MFTRMFCKRVSHADFTDRFFSSGESKVQIDTQFSHTFSFLVGRIFLIGCLTIINSIRKKGDIDRS